MNREHLQAFVWLRWRLRVNQLKKGGVANAVVLAILAGFVVVGSVGMFVAGLGLGALALPEAPPLVRLLIWDGLVLAFLFAWAVGLMADLQRTDPLTLDKFLHLPLSPAGVFLVNYLSSLASITLVLFAPGLLGLVLGSTVGFGVAAVLGVPLLVAFLFALTATTYQFQGWLATLMSNPRRRRTVVVFLTLGFILVFQAPNVINLAVRPWERVGGEAERVAKERDELNTKFTQNQITPQELTKGLSDVTERSKARAEEEEKQLEARAGQIAGIANVVIPPGWLPLGLSSLADGHVVPALLGTFGFVAIGSLSLWRAYRTTLRLFTGDVAAAGSVSGPAGKWDARTRMVEWQLPWVPERAAGVAAAGLRALLPAPEVKMMLIAPVIVVVIFGGLLLSVSGAVPGIVRPLMATGAASFVLLTAVQLAGNQFGYDRAGFRAFVLSPTPRWQILFGKNLAAVPVFLGLAAATALVVGCVFPMRFDHYPAVVAQVVAMFLVFSLLTNILSIIAPIPMASGAIQPSNVKLVPVLFQFGFMMVYPVALVPILAPIGAEALLDEVAGMNGWPVSLALSAVVLAGAAAVYRWAIARQGEWLQSREQAILDVVTSKME